MEFELSVVPMISTVVIAGWAGRDREDVEHHIRELEALGVAPPSATPLFYRVSADRLTQADSITVVGDNTSGEAEPVLVQTDDGLFVGVGSDHTDRTCENFSVALSKQICPKIVGRRFWRYEDVIDHWDDLVLRSYRHVGEDRVLYQEGTLAALLRPERLMELGPASGPSGRGLAAGGLMFCGTMPAIGGIVPSEGLTIELSNPVSGRTITHAYRVDHLPVVA
ncbi:hypothetical protein AA13595_2166 [Gluconacetobacter johannae DSM 13595]|uniref:DUF2848 domain-containing protein n=1 Tax=Gluconacetobacter johannae TaxID=112140 RepID=A0A7W4J507_9PROT|nr:DUF2848 domain-containing protein [Gluconacetobacter johannae]MBB2174845.1 DUF2848 domain-containing protein [Gluconacetobacter johannae]GBQ87489.1 hypothetical protein AA13595_2166 [Gluconacetobacter johannae DSM 13595]